MARNNKTGLARILISAGWRKHLSSERGGVAMIETAATQASEHLKQYLVGLTPQVRGRLLNELERLHLQGEDVPHAAELIAALRAEFRNGGPGHDRAGNPSRYFFAPLEPFLIDGALERAGAGRISRGSLAPIWMMVTERLLRSMSGDYIAAVSKAIAGNSQREAQKLAATFQTKVLTYLDGLLASADGPAGFRTDLRMYTSSPAVFDDLVKVLSVFRAQAMLAEFAATLPAGIVELDADVMPRIFKPLDALRARQGGAVPFALTLIARRLKKPWQLLRLATAASRSRAPRDLLAAPYGVAVPMVFDMIGDKRLTLLDAFRLNHTLQAREILGEVYEIEDAVRSSIDLGDTDWGRRLQALMAEIKVALDSEVNAMPLDHLHLKHVLESASLQPSHSWTERLGRMFRRGQDALVDGLG